MTGSFNPPGSEAAERRAGGRGQAPV